MRCPTCTDERLVITERLGIEIDYCPACRGVWLDRGELDKLIERAGTTTPVAAAPVAATPVPPAPGVATPPPPPPYSRDRYDDDDYDDDYDDRYRGAAPTKKKKRGSFLGELFDFG
jgi:hypothetical protein